MPIKVAVCQVPDIVEDVETSFAWVERFTGEAEAGGVSLICFPECFLQGYLTQREAAEKYAINLACPAFEIILAQLARYKPVIVFGMIEEDCGDFFNTAVVIHNGRLLGKYHKANLLPGEQIFKAGTEYPVFAVDSLKFGINICYDTQFAEPAANIARQGANLLLCPANNMMGFQTAEKFKHLHNTLRIERVRESGLWLMSADVTGERDGRIAYGPTCAINPNGEVIAQVPLMQTGMVVVEI